MFLNATNTYTGPTIINAGTLSLTGGSLSTSSAITDNAVFAINSSLPTTQGTTFSGSAITGTGSLLKQGLGTLTLNAANTYAGGTTISSGTLIVSSSGALGSGNVSLTAGSVTLTLSGATQIASTATLSYLNTDIINLNYAGTDTIAGLTVDGVAQGSGVYGVGFINPDGAFAGTGTITVVPEPTTVAMMALGAGLLVGVQRFRRKLR